MAVPMTVKIPEPITAPMPSEVRLIHPSDFFSCFSGFSESEMSLSMLLQRKSCRANRHPPPTRRAGNFTLRASPVQQEQQPRQWRVKRLSYSRKERGAWGCGASCGEERSHSHKLEIGVALDEFFR